MTTNDETRLLGNVLEGLDRLFDGESSATDLQALIFATSKALSNADYFSILNDAGTKLEELIDSKRTSKDERNDALEITNELRVFIAGLLPFDPRQTP